jgi:exopolyphosphatase/guanosine-5'-triphosphate,3'-diphosphate pyrophosphatase
MIVAVVDVGTNSTRLLVADVRDGRVVREVERRTIVTRLGEGVDESGRLSQDAVERVVAACASYREAIDAHGAERVVAVLTSAVRDAENGDELERVLRERFGFQATTISGEREARLTFLGATAARPHAEPLMVLDIGGGSTEVVIGSSGRVEFFVSTQIGSVRYTERFLHTDPPREGELAACREAIEQVLAESVPHRVRALPADGVAVAGTPTSFAAIDLDLEPYDRERVDGHRMSLERCEEILAQLARVPLEERRNVRGLHPDRAPTIVAGGVILTAAMSLFELTEIEVSEHDILDGTAIDAAETARKRA